MIATNTTTAFAKIQTIVDVMMKTDARGDALPQTMLDEVAIAELHTMVDMSLHCSHLPKKETNTIGFERSPADASAIPSFIEDMKLPLNTSAHAQVKVRANPTICGFMIAAMAMSEFVTRCAHASDRVHSLIITNVGSMKQLSMIKMLFEILQMDVIRNVKATMNIIVNGNMKRNAKRILSANPSVILWPNEQTHWLEVVEEIGRSNPHAETTLTGKLDAIGDVVTLLRAGVIKFVSVGVDVSTIAQARTISIAAEQTDSIMEVPPFMDPDAPVLRLASACVPANTRSRRIVHRPAYWSINALVSWHTKVVRPMNLGGMCCDCRIGFMIASAMLAACGYPNMDPNRRMVEEWSERFAAAVNATDIADRNA